MSPQITLIRKSGTNATLSKRIYIDTDGSVRSDGSQCLMTEGTATRVLGASAERLAGCIAACASNQAIALGALKKVKWPPKLGPEA
jgi:hypothetical protein